MDVLIGLAPQMLSGGIPSGNPQVCRGGDSRRCWALEGTGVVAAISLLAQMRLQRDPRCPGTGCAAFSANPQRLGSGREKGPCTVNCLMPPPSHSSVGYIRLAQTWERISCPV